MEVLINELSLHKQFESLENFADNALPEFVRICSLLIDVNKIPLKNYAFYAQMITQNENFHDLLISKGLSRVSTSVRLYKTQMEKLISDPFWEAQQHHDPNSLYFFKEEIVSGTALAETYERNSILLSFTPSKFEDNVLSIVKENCNAKIVFNFFKRKNILDYLFDYEHISFMTFCINRFDKTNLNFDNAIPRQSFDLITDKNDANQYKLTFELFASLNWEDINRHDGLDYKVHHNQSYFKHSSNGNLIFKFRASKKYRVFGYREGDVFHVVEFDLTHRLSN